MPAQNKGTWNIFVFDNNVLIYVSLIFNVGVLRPGFYFADVKYVIKKISDGTNRASNLVRSSSGASCAKSNLANCRASSARCEINIYLCSIRHLTCVTCLCSRINKFILVAGPILRSYLGQLSILINLLKCKSMIPHHLRVVQTSTFFSNM